MASFSYLRWCLVFIFFGSALAHLTENYYTTSCPQAMSIIKTVVVSEILKESSVAPKLLKLHFTDCLIGGCDGSILLDDTKTSVGEKKASGMTNSSRELEIIDKIKAKLEKACPGVVSCADILAVVTRDSIVTLGGPSWTVPLGRRDSTQAHTAMAYALAPLFFAGVEGQIAAFATKGYCKEDFVALLGTHTVGVARCVTYRKRIYEDKNIDPAYAHTLQAKCPKVGGDNNTAPIDYRTPIVFDNAYFVNLVNKKGLLTTDQQLYSGKGGPTDAIVKNYSKNQTLFFENYVKAVAKTGNLGILTGTNGQIRTNCRKVNGATN